MNFVNYQRKKLLFYLIIIIVFIVFFSWSSFALAKKCNNDANCGGGLKCIRNKCVRALEISYPEIGGERLIEEVFIDEEGLPKYIKYIFTSVVIFFGVIIFGAFVYNGFLYLTSAGNPEKTKEATKGILYAFAGGIVLFSANLIFNTINPQLKIMRLPEVKVLEQVIEPGIYICTYNVDSEVFELDGAQVSFRIENVIKEYLTERGEKQKEAARKLKKIMYKDESKNCPKVGSSRNLKNFEITNRETIFAIPQIYYVEGDTSDSETESRRMLKYEYGIVLHETENFKDKCHLVETEIGGNKIYALNLPESEWKKGQIKGFSANLPNNFKIARSVTLFQKPSTEPVGEGAVLYEKFNHNKDDPDGKMKSFKPGGVDDFLKVTPAELGDLKENTRSIRFKPEGSYFVLMYEGENFDKSCVVISKNNPNISDSLPRSERCGGVFDSCSWWGVGWFIDKFNLADCSACLNSMKVIKGSAL